jgi:hypothetical protein
MGIVAPISAVTAAVIPIGIAAYSEGLPGDLQMMGFGLIHIKRAPYKSISEHENEAVRLQNE